MSLTEILGISGGGILILVLSFIKIPKIEINIWGLLARTIGRALNAEVFTKVDGLSKQVSEIKNTLDQHLIVEKEEKVRDARKRILDFNDEIVRGLYHSKEHFDEILEDIDMYNTYCQTHENYENSKAVLAIQNIKYNYSEKSKDGTF